MVTWHGAKRSERRLADARDSRVERWIAAVAVAALVTACGKAPQAHAPLGSLIGSPVPYPSSAVYEPETGSLIVGSYGDGSLARLPVAQGPHAHAPSLPLDGRQNVLRVRLDEPRARLWVLASDAVYIYHTASSRLLARIPIGDISQHSSEHCLADMALDRAGNAYISSAMRPLLMRVDAQSFEAAQHVLRPDVDSDKDFGLSALAFADGALYAASATIGRLWKVDYVNGTAQHVEISERIFGACALHATAPAGHGNHDATLYVAGGFRAGMKRIDIESPTMPYHVSRLAGSGAPNVPTDFAIVGHELYIMSSRLAEHPDFDGEASGPSRFSIVRLAAP